MVQQKKFVFSVYEQIKKLRRMECLWRLFGHWQQAGYCYQQDQAVFYVCLYSDTGVTYHYLHDTCLLEKYPQIHLGG